MIPQKKKLIFLACLCFVVFAAEGKQGRAGLKGKSGKPGKPGKPGRSGRTGIKDYQRSPSTNSDERGTATAAMLRSIDNMDDKKDFCDDSLCPAGKKHVGCGEQADWYGGKCAIDAHLLHLDETLKDFILDTFNNLRNTVARGGYSGFTEAARMGTMVWQPELAEIAKFNVLICKLHQDDCRNTAEYKDVGQSAGYRAVFGRSENLNRSIKATINLWFNEQGKTSMDEVLKYKHEYSKEKGNFLQIVLENSIKVGCAALRQTLNGWLQTFFTCNYGYSPVPGHPVYEISTKGEQSCETGKNPNYEYLCSVDETYEEKKPVKAEVSQRSAKSDIKDLLTKRIFDDQDPEGNPAELDDQDKMKLQHKFDRYMDKMNKSSKLAEGRQVVVVTSNHELDIDFEDDGNDDEKRLASRSNNVEIGMRSRPASLHQREPFQGAYPIKGISARTASATKVPQSAGIGAAKWIAI